MDEKWEYMVSEAEDWDSLREYLDKAGSDGWELVQVNGSEHNFKIVGPTGFIFKKSVRAHAEPSENLAERVADAVIARLPQMPKIADIVRASREEIERQESLEPTCDLGLTSPAMKDGVVEQEGTCGANHLCPYCPHASRGEDELRQDELKQLSARWAREALEQKAKAEKYERWYNDMNNARIKLQTELKDCWKELDQEKARSYRLESEKDGYLLQVTELKAQLTALKQPGEEWWVNVYQRPEHEKPECGCFLYMDKETAENNLRSATTGWIGTFPVYLPTPREQSEKEQLIAKAKEILENHPSYSELYDGLLKRALILLEGEKKEVGDDS